MHRQCERDGVCVCVVLVVCTVSVRETVCVCVECSFVCVRDGGSVCVGGGVPVACTVCIGDNSSCHL